MPAEEDKINRAAALAFDSEADRAPRLIARGQGAFAREMVDVARETGRPIIRDEALSEVLAALPVGGEIPENLYRAVSGIFALIYQLETQTREATPHTK